MESNNKISFSFTGKVKKLIKLCEAFTNNHCISSISNNNKDNIEICQPQRHGQRITIGVYTMLFCKCPKWTLLSKEGTCYVHENNL